MKQTITELDAIMKRGLSDEEKKIQVNAYKIHNSEREKICGPDADMAPELRALWYKSKDNGQYGYYAGQPHNLPIILKRLGVRSLVDLGAGLGIMLKVLRDAVGIRVAGFEIEDVLIKGSKNILGNNCIKKGDITKLTTADIKRFDVIYFWTPFADHKKQVAFEKHLTEIAVDGQYILALSWPEYLKTTLPEIKTHWGNHLFQVSKPK